MSFAAVQRIAVSALLAAALAAACSGGRDDASVLGTKFASDPCPVAGGSTVVPGVHPVTASNAPLTLVVSGGRFGGVLAPPQQIDNGGEPSPNSTRLMDFTLALREGSSPETVIVTAKLRNTTGCSVELREGRVTVQPTEPAGAATTLTIRFEDENRRLLPPGGEATGTATHTVTGDGASDVSASIAAAVGVVR
jgi:hypothetical protein